VRAAVGDLMRAFAGEVVYKNCSNTIAKVLRVCEPPAVGRPRGIPFLLKRIGRGVYGRYGTGVDVGQMQREPAVGEAIFLESGDQVSSR
jgi:hypothetical protein